MTFRQIQSGSSHQRQTLVFLPGWGFDGQVARYGVWPEDVDLLVPTGICHPGLAEELQGYLAVNKITRVALVGWSMGAHVAWQFAEAHPEMVSSLNLLSSRQSWPPAEIAEIKTDLGVDLRKTMQGFYRKCFLGHKALYRNFVETLERDYLERLQRSELEAGLDYLACQPVVGTIPAGLAAQLIHGRKDVVAPVAERPHLKGASEQIVEGAGHLLFAQPHTYLL